MIVENKILETYKNLKDDEPNIIRGAINADLNEIKRALQNDPNCINEVHDGTGVTALHIAVFDGNYSIVDLLCDQPGLRIDIMDKFHRTPYLAAIIMGDDDILDRLMKTLDLEPISEDERDKDGAEVFRLNPASTRPPEP